MRAVSPNIVKHGQVGSYLCKRVGGGSSQGDGQGLRARVDHRGNKQVRGGREKPAHDEVWLALAALDGHAL